MTAKALLPSTSVIAFTLGNGLSFTTFVNTVPINEHRTVNRFALVRKLSADKLGVFNWNAWDSIARQAMIRCALLLIFSLHAVLPVCAAASVALPLALVPAGCAIMHHASAVASVVCVQLAAHPACACNACKLLPPQSRSQNRQQECMWACAGS